MRLLPLLMLFACTPKEAVKLSAPEDTDAASDDSPADDSPVEAADDSADDSAADDSATEETASPTDTGEEPPGPLPLSSRCIDATDTQGFCARGVYAEDSSGVRYEWVLVDGYNHSVLRAVEDGVNRTITNLATLSSWHSTAGLTVMPDGDLVLAGATLPYVTFSVGSQSVSFGADYVRFVARISPDGTLEWVKTFVGLTGEDVVVSARADDSVLVSGNIFQDTVFGDHTVTTTYFWDNTFLAALDDSGDWLWATGATVPSQGYTRVYFDDMVGTPDGGAQIAVRYLSSTAVSLFDFSCATGVTCAATATVSDSGEWTGLVGR